MAVLCQVGEPLSATQVDAPSLPPLGTGRASRSLTFPVQWDAVTDDLSDRLPAGDLVRTLARIIGGGGGGRPDLAEAGGKDPSRLDEALSATADAVRSKMEAKS